MFNAVSYERNYGNLEEFVFCRRVMNVLHLITHRAIPARCGSVRRIREGFSIERLKICSLTIKLAHHQIVQRDGVNTCARTIVPRQIGAPRAGKERGSVSERERERPKRPSINLVQFQ
jgi:hypothetical protein